MVSQPSTSADIGRGYQSKVHANDEVIAVNKHGTYGFAYLEPDEYFIVSQAGTSTGYRLVLEAGEGYYFMQYQVRRTGWFKTGFERVAVNFLRHSKEVVMHELDGLYYAKWKRKTNN